MINSPRFVVLSILSFAACILVVFNTQTKADEFGVDFECETSAREVLIGDVCFIRVTIRNRGDHKFTDFVGPLRYRIKVRFRDQLSGHLSPSLIALTPRRAIEALPIILPGGSEKLVGMIRVVITPNTEPTKHVTFDATYKYDAKTVGTEITLKVAGTVLSRNSQLGDPLLRLHGYEVDADSMLGDFNDPPLLFPKFPFEESSEDCDRLLSELREDSTIARLIKLSQRHHELIRSDVHGEDHGALLYAELLRFTEIELIWLVKQLHRDLSHRNFAAAAFALKDQAIQDGIWKVKTIE